MCPSTDEILSLISFCIPVPIANEIIITIIPIEIAVVPIFIIGDEMLFLWKLALEIFLTKKCSKFKTQYLFY